MESTLVIKVKYGDTLRRFSAQVDEDGELDIDMNGLRKEILYLFNFAANADLILTYVDEDGDVVTIVNDNDLHDVLKQRLKFLKVDVQLNNGLAKSTGSSMPMRSPQVQNPLPDINKAVVADVFKSVPEPSREALSKLALELASKPTPSSSVMIEYLERAYKIGRLTLNPNQVGQEGMGLLQRAVGGLQRYNVCGVRQANVNKFSSQSGNSMLQPNTSQHQHVHPQQQLYLPAQMQAHKFSQFQQHNAYTDQPMKSEASFPISSTPFAPSPMPGFSSLPNAVGNLGLQD